MFLRLNFIGLISKLLMNLGAQFNFKGELHETRKHFNRYSESVSTESETDWQMHFQGRTHSSQQHMMSDDIKGHRWKRIQTS